MVGIFSSAADEEWKDGIFFMQFVIIGIYIAIMIGVAVFSAKKATTLNDFYLGGRSIGGWMTAFSYGTTYFSAVMFVGYAGRLGYQFGLSVIWIGIGNAILGSYVAWKLLAKPTHDMTRRLDVSTMPAFFEKRFLSKNMKIFRCRRHFYLLGALLRFGISGPQLYL